MEQLKILNSKFQITNNKLQTDSAPFGACNLLFDFSF